MGRCAATLYPLQRITTQILVPALASLFVRELYQHDSVLRLVDSLPFSNVRLVQTKPGISAWWRHQETLVQLSPAERGYYVKHYAPMGCRQSLVCSFIPAASTNETSIKLPHVRWDRAPYIDADCVGAYSLVSLTRR